MDRLPPLTAIRAFESAGRHENFSRAAEELGMTQAAISYQIRALEDRIGKALFLREKGRVRLSDTGRRLLPALSGAFSAMGEAFAALRSEDDEVLALDTFTSFGSTWLAARIGHFQMRYPDLAVRITLSNEPVDLVSGPVDVAFRAGAGGWEGLRAEFLFRQHFTPMCTPAFRDQHSIETAQDLLRVQRFGPNDALWAGWFRAAGMEAPEARRGVILDNQTQEASALMGGFGVAMMSPLYWRADLESGRLVRLFDTLYVGQSALWLTHAASRVGVRKIERLREWVREELAKDREFLPAEVWEAPT